MAWQEQGSLLPGGLSDTQWQLLMLSEEVGRLRQQLRRLRGQAGGGGGAGDGQGASASRAGWGGVGSDAACPATAAAAAPPGHSPSKIAAERGRGHGAEGVHGGFEGGSTERISLGGEEGGDLAAGGAAVTSEHSTTNEITASSSTGDGSVPAGGAAQETGESGGSDAQHYRQQGMASASSPGRGVADAPDCGGAPPAGLQPVQGRQLPKPAVNLHLPQAELQHQVSQLAALMMELEEQVGWEGKGLAQCLCVRVLQPARRCAVCHLKIVHGHDDVCTFPCVSMRMFLSLAGCGRGCLALWVLLERSTAMDVCTHLNHVGGYVHEGTNLPLAMRKVAI